MHVVLYHDALIPPVQYGGTERIVYWLARALSLKGHQVTLMARPGSIVPGVKTLPLGPNQRSSWAFHLPKDADVVHLWGTPDCPPKIPFLVTIQGNGKPGERFHPNTVFISKKHAENHGSDRFVYNGIDPDDYPCDPPNSREDYLVFLAKASWKVKNLGGAIELARASSRPLYVMGNRDWSLGLRKRLPAWRGVQYFGMVGDREKRKLLRKAYALLFPVRWPEPFGIAITEALASGCAVFGTPYGSLPEIVTPDVGALSTQAQELLTAIRDHHYSPDTCRNRVLSGFTHLQMAAKYVSLYQEVIERGSLSLREPVARFQESPETLLKWEGLRSGFQQRESRS